MALITKSKVGDFEIVALYEDPNHQSQIRSGRLCEDCQTMKDLGWLE